MISKKIFLYFFFIFSYILSGYSTELDKVISQIDEYNQNSHSKDWLTDRQQTKQQTN